MSISNTVPKKRRGRPPIIGKELSVPVHSRISKPTARALDDWAAEDGQSRAQKIMFAIEFAMRHFGKLPDDHDAWATAGLSCESG